MIGRRLQSGDILIGKPRNGSITLNEVVDPFVRGEDRDKSTPGRSRVPGVRVRLLTQSGPVSLDDQIIERGLIIVNGIVKVEDRTDQ